MRKAEERITVYQWDSTQINMIIHSKPTACKKKMGVFKIRGLPPKRMVGYKISVVLLLLGGEMCHK